MRTLVIFILALVVTSCEKDELYPDTFYQCQLQFEEGNLDHSSNTEFQALIERITASGVPGIQFSVTNPEGSWNGAFGLADLASRIDMQSCNITRVGSTVKTFTAVSILLLHEEGLLDIADPISDYLSPSQIEGLDNANAATIEQLLKHSSGIYNYIQSANFQTASLNHLTRVWQPEELMAYARGQEANFSLGSDVLYSNTNYILLGWIIESVTGQPFYESFEERLFKPLGLEYTQFAAEDPVPHGIVRGYVDFYSDYNLINSTDYSGWDYFTADGGLISNAYDLNLFLHSLFNGEILTHESMQLMLDWQDPKSQDEEEYYISYGLGIFKIETAFGPAYLHSGDAIGYFASMVHFPNQNTTITWAVNGNYGKIDDHTQTKEAMDRIFQTVLGSQN